MFTSTPIRLRGAADYRRIAEETLDYVLREMSSPSGGFYSSQDADADGEEGRYYLWTRDEIIGVLGEEDGRLVGRYFGIGLEVDVEGRSILHIPKDLAMSAAEMGISPADFGTVVEDSRAKLREVRERRPRPPRDEKILASWNGLMLQALAEAAGVLGREDYMKAAVANAGFLVRGMMNDGVLMHSYKDGASGVPGYLEDYAAMIRGLVCLHEATFEQSLLQTAFDLADAMMRRFSDEKNPGLLYDTGADQGGLFIRPRDTSDSVKPCGGSSAAEVLLRMSRITGVASYEGVAGAMLRRVQDQMSAYPLASGNWLCALDFSLSDPEEVVVVGRRDDPRTKALLTALNGRYLPNRILVGFQPGGPVSPLLDNLAKGRATVEGRPAVYICRGRTCHAPVTDPDQLRRLLQT